MYISKSYIQTTNSPSLILKGLIETSTNVDFDSFLAAVAYATMAGSILLNDKLRDNVDDWDSPQKRWLISIDYGNTEPQALAFLAKLPNSEVRIPNASAILANRLRPDISYHPKLYLFQHTGTEALGVFSGSANLSLSGLQLNTEQAVSKFWGPPLTPSEEQTRGELQSMIDTVEGIYSIAEMVTDDLIDTYQDLYKQLQHIREDTSKIAVGLAETKRVVDPEFAAVLATANYFWIDIKYVVDNLGQGLPGNQIDTPRGTRVFFGFGVGDVPRNTSFGNVAIEYKGIGSECGLRFGNNQMDKLNLPIPNNPGPPTYVNQTLLFERLADNKFALYLGTEALIALWKSTSRNQGTLFAMQGGREFGAFN